MGDVSHSTTEPSIWNNPCLALKTQLEPCQFIIWFTGILLSFLYPVHFGGFSPHVNLGVWAKLGSATLMDSFREYAHVLCIYIYIHTVYTLYVYNMYIYKDIILYRHISADSIDPQGSISFIEYAATSKASSQNEKVTVLKWSFWEDVLQYT